MYQLSLMSFMKSLHIVLLCFKHCLFCIMLCLLSKAAALSNYLMTGTDPTIRQHPPASYTSLYTAQYCHGRVYFPVFFYVEVNFVSHVMPHMQSLCNHIM